MATTFRAACLPCTSDCSCSGSPWSARKHRFSALNLFFLISFILVFIVLFNPWLAAFWMLLLLSLLTGRIFARGLSRAAYGLAVIILFIQLTLVTTPELFHLSQSAGFS